MAIMLADLLRSARSPYETFEGLVLSLLSRAAEDEGKRFQRGGRVGSREVDAIAPEGVLDIVGPTIIEIKAGNVRQSGRMVVDRLAVLSSGFGDNALLVLGSSLPAKDRQALEAWWKEATVGFAKASKLYIWDRDVIEHLASKYPDAAARILPEYAERSVPHLAAALSVEKDVDWRDQRRAHIRALSQAYSSEGIALFLGAGVSADSKIPPWTELLAKLTVKFIDTKVLTGVSASEAEHQALASAFATLQDSPLIAAQYLGSALDDAFVASVSEAMYSTLDDEAMRNSPLLRTIARMCVPKPYGVQEVVTYNFDDLVEHHLDEFGVPYRAVYRDGYSVSQNVLPVYHVHGFLPRDKVRYSGLGESLLVFAEDGYNVLASDPYQWANVVQASILRESTCVLVGLSLTDPNLRRLLYLIKARSKSAKHYAFLRRVQPSKILDAAPPTVLSDATVSRFLLAHHRLQESLFERLGVSIIWYEERKEVSELLDEIRRGTT